MINEISLILLAAGALGLFGILLIFQKIRRALKTGGKTADQKFVEKLLKGDARLAKGPQIAQRRPSTDTADCAAEDLA